MLLVSSIFVGRIGARSSVPACISLGDAGDRHFSLHSRYFSLAIIFQRLTDRGMPSFPRTQYFDHTRRRSDRSLIEDEWILKTVHTPEYQTVQLDGRIRRWRRIPEFDNKALRVILLEDGYTVHNAFFDRDFTEERL